MKTIEFWGGFHKVGSIRLRISDEQAKEIEELDSDFEGIEWILSEHQMNRLDKHFCGMHDCCCCGVHRDAQFRILG